MRHRCAICNRLCDESRMRVVNCCWVCDACVVPRCDECGRETIVPFTITLDDGNIVSVCEHCLSSYGYCAVCNRYFRKTQKDNVCDDCREQGFRVCQQCGAIFQAYNGIEDVCDECMYPKAIRNYSFDPSWSYLGGREIQFDGNLRFGVELEVDDGHHPYACANMLKKISPYIYCKHDSSLSPEAGFEIISYPATLDFHLHQMNWETICRAAKVLYGYRSHNTRTCGLHVHVGLENVGRTTDAKIVALTDAIFPFMETIARRGANYYAQKVDAGICSTDSPHDAIAKARELGGRDHHLAVSTCGKAHTVEFRLFKGTLNPDTIKATLVFVDCVVRYADTHTMQECVSANYKDVIALSDEPVFVNYVARRVKGMEVGDEKH